MEHTPTARAPFLAMLRGAAPPTLLAAGVCLLVAGTTRGSPGLVGAALGAGLVLVSSFSTLSVLLVVDVIPPAMSLGVALLAYVTKVSFLGVALITLRDASWLDPRAFGLTTALCLAVWMAGQVRAFLTMRQPIYDGTS